MVNEALNSVVDALTKAGIAATVDPPRLNPPAVWVTARRLGRSVLGACGGYAVVVDLYLIARDTGIPRALETLDGLLTHTIEVMDEHQWDMDSSALDETVTLPSGGGPLPAYRLTYLID
ncbi:hypothetical protein [Corynebacterium oculi]|uniref:Uncharacterized protein n=1 Tax=Corynebacterium oculi TaxID=1544416 RepID=A0A0Q1AE62_9CORY|nr:hypothetical protein [Corynebacterium oculi]KQB84939.1 hypothetical protein Cocul_00069 [Corynebacterium oculi]